MDCSQVPLSVKFSRQEYWSGWPCPSPEKKRGWYQRFWPKGTATNRWRGLWEEWGWLGSQIWSLTLDILEDQMLTIHPSKDTKLAITYFRWELWEEVYKGDKNWGITHTQMKAEAARPEKRQKKRTTEEWTLRTQWRKTREIRRTAGGWGEGRKSEAGELSVQGSSGSQVRWNSSITLKRTAPMAQQRSKSHRTRFRENGPQLDRERWEGKPQLEAGNTDNPSGEFYYEGRKEMRLQLQDESQINNFFNEVKPYLHTNGGEWYWGRG